MYLSNHTYNYLPINRLIHYTWFFLRVTKIDIRIHV